MIDVAKIEEEAIAQAIERWRRSSSDSLTDLIRLAFNTVADLLLEAEAKEDAARFYSPD